ncbi:MAG: hypothetical protein KC910_15645 [Candidatus Eremiobacteraeota bacterium]|nr:hypothetical protein [Candidatus Eremiobacteraeota bacterium]
MGRFGVSKRGIALISVLMLCALLLTLIGAFVTVNQASSRLTGNTLTRNRAQDACMAAVDLAWYELELDKDWGTGASLGYPGVNLVPSANPHLRLQEQTDAEGLYLTGSLSESADFDAPNAARFELRIYNNLNSRYPLAGDYPVQPRSVRLRVKAQCGLTTRTLDTLLRQVPFSHESLAANGRASVNGNLARFESHDPYINRLKADEMVLPSAANTRFVERGEAAVTDGNSLYLGGSNLASPGYNKAPDEKTTGGQFTLDGASPNVPDLDSSKLKLPSATVELDGGTYEFGNLDRIEWVNHTIGYSVPDPLGGSHTEYCTRFQKKTTTYTSLNGPNGKSWVSDNATATAFDPPYDPSYGDTGYGYASEGVSSPPLGVQQDVWTIAGTEGAGVTVNLATGQMTVSSGVTVHADGDFFLVADGDTAPQLLFGYDIDSGGVPMQQSLRDGLQAAQDDPKTYMAAMTTDGDFKVSGDAAGYGSILANGALTLQASSGFRSAPELGVVIKGETVTINPAKDPEPSFPGEPTSVDYSVFRDAINTYAGGDWTNFDQWLDLTGSQRDAIVGTAPGADLRSTQLPQNADYYYNQLKAEMGLTLPPPNFAAEYGSEWGGSTISLEQYARMKEWMQTVASGFKKGNGDDSWMHMDQRVNEVGTRLENQLSSHASWAKSYKVDLQTYLANPDQVVPDMFYQGLLYAGNGGLTVNAAGKSVRLEGSMLSKGDLLIDGSKVEVVYDRDLLDDLFQSTLGANGLRLERVFFNLN